MKKRKNENENNKLVKGERDALKENAINKAQAVDQALIKEVFLGVFVVLSMKDIHHLKAKLVSFGKSGMKLEGYVEITESFEGVNVIGKVEGLASGSTHAVHVLEYSDLPSLDPKKITKDFLKHFNPTNSPHSCPSAKESEEEKFHAGDFGNIIANHEGSAFLSLTRKVSIRSLNGRLVVINNSADKCDPNQDYDKLTDIIAYGAFSTVKPTVPSPHNYNN